MLNTLGTFSSMLICRGKQNIPGNAQKIFHHPCDVSGEAENKGKVRARHGREPPCLNLSRRNLPMHPLTEFLEPPETTLADVMP